MRIEYHGPTQPTGVSDLMYVGDDGLPGGAPQDVKRMIGIAILAFAAGKTSGLTRVAAIAGAASLVWPWWAQ